jgi:hypothetical protein
MVCHKTKPEWNHIDGFVVLAFDAVEFKTRVPRNHIVAKAIAVHGEEK